MADFIIGGNYKYAVKYFHFADKLFNTIKDSDNILFDKIKTSISLMEENLTR